MTAWIVLSGLTALAALALRHGRPEDPPLPQGYDGERQLAELRALVVCGRSTTCGTARPPSIRRSRTLQEALGDHRSTA
jgi:hypothetical protein